MNKELAFLRAYAFATVIGIFTLGNSSFKPTEKNRFKEIDVERINIVEKDGKISMIITNEGKFPTGQDIINGRKTNSTRKKRSGMIFFNNDGIECGGLIYDGQKNEKGHSSGLSLTYDQYDGDQVMQLKNIDFKEGDARYVSSSLVFNDRPSRESQLKTEEIMVELNHLRATDKTLWRQKFKEYQEQGFIGETPRIMLGKTQGLSNGLFLNDSKGNPKVYLYVDKDNNAKLEFYDEKGNVSATFPEKK